MSSSLDKFIFYESQKLAIPAISAITDPSNSSNSKNSNALESAINEISSNSPDSRHIPNSTNSGNSNVLESDKTESQEHLAYHYRLKDGGGTYITDEPDLTQARDSLAVRYGSRLLVVTRAGRLETSE